MVLRNLSPPAVLLLALIVRQAAAWPTVAVEVTQSSCRHGSYWVEDFDRGGRRSEGLELGCELGSDVRWGPLSGSWSWRGRAGEHLPARGQLLEALLQIRAGPVGVTVGRGHPYWGPAEDGALLLSHHPPPLDHASLRVDDLDPLLLPGCLSGETLLAYLDDRDRVVPYPLLWGMRLRWQPLGWLDLEARRTIMLGGVGRGELLTASDLWDIFLGRGESKRGSDIDASDTDQKFAGVLRFHPPRPWLNRILHFHDLEIFVFYGGEDSFSGFAPMAPGKARGLRIHPTPRLAFSLVYTSNPDDWNQWYFHKVYQTGYRYRGWVIGHPMGGDARTWRGCLAYSPGAGQWMMVRVTRERRGYYWHDRATHAVPAGRHWWIEFGYGIPWGPVGLQVEVGASAAREGDRWLDRPAAGMARLRLAWPQDTESRAEVLTPRLVWDGRP